MKARTNLLMVQITVFMTLIATSSSFAQVGPIVINRVDIDDDDFQFSHDESKGNGNDIIEAGETIRLRVYLTNTGNQDAENVIATIATTNQFFSFSDKEEEYKTIAAGATVEPYHFFSGYGGFIFTVSPGVPTDSVLFQLDIRTSNAGSFATSMKLLIKGGTAGPLSIADFRIDDDTNNFADDKSNGDNDDKIEPGETIGLPIRLKNNGDLPAIDVKAKLRVTDSRISLIDSVVNYPVIDANQSQWPDDFVFGEQFHFTIDSDADSGNLNVAVVVSSFTGPDTTFPLVLYIEPRGVVNLQLVRVDFDDDRRDFRNRRVRGNNNDIMEPRETIAIIPTVQNIGTASALSAKGILRTDSPHASVVDSLVDFETISEGQTKTPAGFGDERGFIFRIAHTAPTGPIFCQFIIQTGTGNVFEETITVNVDASNSPPPNQIVVVESPKEGEIVREARTDVFGYVDDFATPYVLVNGDTVVPSDGFFEAYVLTRRGPDTLKVFATNSSGQAGEIIRTFIGQPFSDFPDKSRLFLHHAPGRNIKQNFLSEFGPGCTRSEFTFFSNQPGAVEWIFLLNGDIQGNQYKFSLLLASVSSTNYLCEIIHSRDTSRTTLSSTTFFTSSSSYRRFEATVVGSDPDAVMGDSLILRISFNAFAHIFGSDFSSDPFGCSSIPSYIEVPKLFVVSVDLPSLDGQIPSSFELSQNYPNPFNPETTIKYQLSEATEVKLEIYNLLGQRVAMLVDKKQPAGYYSIKWDGKDDLGRNVSSGVYLYQLRTKEYVDVKRLLLLR